jgi:hypothetical protein
VRDFTNLQWPESPFGAEQRPFGKHTDMLAAFAVEWADRPDAEPLPVGAATVYLRVRKHGTALHICPGTLSIGFRASIIDRAADVPDLLALVDRALTRARRHAVIVAGHRLDGDLRRLAALSSVPMRGAAGVLAAWANRGNRERGVALMVDTDMEARTVRAALDMPLYPQPVSRSDKPEIHARLHQIGQLARLPIGPSDQASPSPHFAMRLQESLRHGCQHQTSPVMPAAST